MFWKNDGNVCYLRILRSSDIEEWLYFILKDDGSVWKWLILNKDESVRYHVFVYGFWNVSRLGGTTASIVDLMCDWSVV